MFKRTHIFYWIGFFALLTLWMSGCDKDTRRSPVMPEQTNFQNATHLTNFHSSRGLSDGYGAYVGHENFVIQVPDGEYLLEYVTDMGTFYIVFRAAERSLLYVGLRSGDAVQKAVVYPGTITDTSQETQEYGSVTLFCWPGSSVTWSEVFRMS